ncbi:MAG: family 1 glycosylhydrolase [Chloroflexota bacterium]|nr:family 1 glycosylhydrolase [Chloroflexota bacterium]
MTDSPLLRTDGFLWCVGIEDTFIGQPIRHSGYALDEYELTQHYRFWREDLDRAASLGVGGIRYGIPWYRVNPAPGRFEWSWVDEVLEYAVHAKGLAVIADLVHYGVPSWVEHGFADEAYPAAVADYAGTFARRYRSLVQHYTPLNEPIITAQFCGRRGHWPPYLVGDEGWVRVVLGVAAGIQSSITAIRHEDDQAVIVHVEAARQVEGSEELAAQVQEEALRAFLPTDLVLGLVDREHPLTEWLLANGAMRSELDRLRSLQPRIDVLGINYYPDFSRRELVRHNGALAEVAVDGGAAGLQASLTAFHDRYGLPLLVSETSTDGDDARRIAWLRASVAAVGYARTSGVPIRGYTWWPLFDFVDWSHSIGNRRMEDFLVREAGSNGASAFVEPFQPTGTPGADPTPFLRRMGLWRLKRDAKHLRRIETPAAEELRSIVQRFEATDVKVASR